MLAVSPITVHNAEELFEMPIDYSKWDNLECSDSEEEEPSSAPRVTRLDEPSRVTFGGTVSDEGTARVEAVNVVAVPETTEKQQNNKTSEDRPIAFQPSSPKGDLQSWTERGGSLTTKDGRKLFWSQDRYSVHLRLQLRDNETIDRVIVDGILPYSNRHCAMGTIKSKLSIQAKKKIINGCSSDNVGSLLLLEGDLPHPVHWSQDDDPGAGSLDWTIERSHSCESERFASLVLHKGVPMQGVFVWWKRPLTLFDETTLEEDCSSSPKDFLRTWEEAHKQFREKKRPGPQALSST